MKRQNETETYVRDCPILRALEWFAHGAALSFYEAGKVDVAQIEGVEAGGGR